MRRDQEKEEQEREKARQKSKEKAEPQSQETETPVAPAPSSIKPTPRPSSVPTGQRAASGPVTNAPDRLEPLAAPVIKNPESKQPETPKPGIASVAPETTAQPGKANPPAVGKERTASLLPVTKENTARAVPFTARPVQEEKRPTQIWYVQVASLSQGQDAEVLAKKLRDKGYDAYVAPAEVNGKNWHRVRVGRFADREAANEIQKTLKSTEKLEQTFIAAGR